MTDPIATCSGALSLRHMEWLHVKSHSSIETQMQGRKKGVQETKAKG